MTRPGTGRAPAPDLEFGAPPEAFGLGVCCGCQIDGTGLVHALCGDHVGKYSPGWAWDARQALDRELDEAVASLVARSGFKYDKTHRPAAPTPNFAVARPVRTG